MVRLIHDGAGITQLDRILSVAQTRFGLYGFEKTTMREIAEELNVSKGSLYYYFPDKENLYKAVVEKEQEEFLKLFRNKIGSINGIIMESF